LEIKPDEVRRGLLMPMGSVADLGRSRRLVGWGLALLRPMKLMDSISLRIGLAAAFQRATTSSIGGGGDGKPNSSQ
jgi:hypothetical protein